MNNYTEAVTRAKKGDQEAFTYLYEQTYSRCLYTATDMMKNRYTAQDVLQEAYVKAFKTLDQLKDPEKFRPWMQSIVINKCKDALKKRNPELFADTEDEDGHYISATFEDDRISVRPDLKMDQKETQRLMREIINTLSDEQRICIVMFYMDQMSVKEMAETLEVSENTVKSRLNYGRKKIKDKVLDLEKKGTKLYGLAPIPFFLFLFKEDVKAAQYEIPPMSAAVKEATKTIVTATSTTTGTVAGTATATAAKGISTKVIAGIVAGALVVGGGTAAVVYNNGNASMKLKTVESYNQLPEWAQYSSGTKVKYINIPGYKYPVSVEYFKSDNETEMTVKFKSGTANVSYKGIISDNNKVMYFGEYDDTIYYAYKNDDFSYLYRVPDAEYYNMYADDYDTYSFELLYDIAAYNTKELLPIDDEKDMQYKQIREMIRTDGYNFDEWYAISEDDLLDPVDAYNDWVTNGESEMDAIYESHITLTIPEDTETEEADDSEPISDVPDSETEDTETETETEDTVSSEQNPTIPVPANIPSDYYWNSPGVYTNSSGQSLSYSEFTEDDGSGCVGNISGGPLPGTLDVYYDGGIYYLRTSRSSESGYAFTMENSGDTLDYYGTPYVKILIKLYYNGVLQGEYYETDLYQS